MEIRNIWCVGRNYEEHAKELGNSVPQKNPMIFLKAGSCIVTEDRPVRLPKFSKDIHHEIEMALQFDQRLEVSNMGLGIDFTARDTQNHLRESGHPWTLAKSFTDACALGKWIPCSNPDDVDFLLKVNGQLRQKGNTKNMIFKVEQIVNYIKNHFPVVAGDVILTGTPSGIAPVKSGDVLDAEMPGRLTARWTIK